MAGLAVCAHAAAQAAIWTVAAGTELNSVAQAIARAADGDEIRVLPGTYRGDVAVIRQRRLTIRGMGQRPVLLADGHHAEGKAIWVVRDGEITIDNIEFRGARVPDFNGAGIRFERGRLLVSRCAFFDNEIGILTANTGDAELLIERSEFGHAPTHGGDWHHLLYVGRIAQLSVRDSHFHDGHEAHLIKSRAQRSTIIGNTIVDGPLGRAAYEIDLPNGGMAWVADNTIGQSAESTNAVMLSFGAEGSAWPRSALTLLNNHMINERRWGGSFVRVWRERLPADVEITVHGNRLEGPGGMDLGIALPGGAALPGAVP